MEKEALFCDLGRRN